jgi:hypothetical protein
MMNGYIYTMAAGADPGHGWIMNDPIFGDVPTLGACVPNIRRVVEEGDYIFVVSGRVRNERQFVVGCLAVDEKISALAAHRRFPENRVHLGDSGQVLGNVIVNGRGEHHPLDDHDNFSQRVQNYIVGRDPVVLTTPAQQRAGRLSTVDFLSHLFGKRGTRVFDIIGRHRKMSEEQVKESIDWLRDLAE